MARKLRIFISSPGDVAAERERAEQIIRKVDADLRDVELEVIRWEQRPYSAVATFQAQIDRPSACDLVVCIFWKRLGTVLPPEFNRDDGSARTGTEYEFEDALIAARQRPDKVPDIFVYRSAAPIFYSEATLTQEQAEKQALDAFWARWMRNAEGHFLAAFKMFDKPDAFARQFERDLRDWLDNRLRQTDWDIAREGSPFLGLAAFDETHASVFFGRRHATKRLYGTLMAADHSGFASVFVLGASGAGKSSLVRAGLIPRLMVPGAAEPLIEARRRLVVTPSGLGEDPVAGLAAALAADPDALPEILAGDCRTVSQLASLMAAGPEQAAIPVVAALDRVGAGSAAGSGDAAESQPTGLVLVVDQFEELFSARDDAARHRLLALVTALVETKRVWLVVTMRSDFYASLQADPPSLELKRRSGVFDVEPPSGADIREMIEAPARASGLAYETAGDRDLAQLLESEATRAGALPMLQYTLQALFEARREETQTLTLAEYDRLGGMAGALAHKAEDAFARLDEAAQKELPRVLGALATVDLTGERTAATARPADLGQFPPGTPARRLIDVLAAERLLVAFGAADAGGAGEDPEHAAPTVRIAHESLFERWPRAARLLADSRLDFDWRTRLERAQREHQAAVDAGDARGARERLLEGNRLSNAVDLRNRRADLLSPPVIAFITASERAAHAKRNRKRMAVAAIIAALTAFGGAAAVLGLWANEQRQEAELQRKEAQSNLALARNVIDGTLEKLESPDMQRVWGFTDIEADLLIRLAGVQQQLPEDEGGAGAHAEAVMDARLGLAHQRRADVEAAIEHFDRAYARALPLAEAEGATPEDRALLLRIAYYRQPLLGTFGRTEDIERQVEVVTPIAERALSDPNDSDGASWAAHYFDRVRWYHQARKRYDEALEASNKAIAYAEPALDEGTSFERKLDLSIFYSNRAPVWNLKNDKARWAADFARGCALAQELYEEDPRHRNVLNGYLYCLFDQSDQFVRNGSRPEAVRLLDQVREIAKEAARYAGTETKFQAARGAERYKYGYIQHHVDKDLRAARDLYEEGLLIYAQILEKRTAELDQHDYLVLTVSGYVGVAEGLEDRVADAEEKDRLRGDHARRLQIIFDQFLACAERLTGRSQCGQAALSAGRSAADRMSLIGRLGETDPAMLATLVRLADEYADHPVRAELSEPFEQACHLRRLQGEGLTAGGDPGKAVQVLTESAAYCRDRHEQFAYDFYLRSQWFGIMRNLAEAYAAAGEVGKAREAFKACAGSFAPGCYEPYARMLEAGEGGPVDRAEAERVRSLTANSKMKRFTVPVIEEGSQVRFPFHLYIFERPPGWTYEGIEDQAIWLEKNRGLIVPQDVRDSFIKLEQIAKRNDASFPDLAVYALGNASKDTTASAETDGPAGEGAPAAADVAAAEAEQPDPAQADQLAEQPAAPPEQARPPVAEPDGETEVAVVRPVPAVTAEPPDTVYRKALSRLIDGDLAAAGDLFADASGRGHARATYELARLNLRLYEGDFDGDPDRGRALMRQAADAGVVAAQVYQGEAAEAAGNREQAIGWYEKAAEQGNMRAKERLRLLSRQN